MGNGRRCPQCGAELAARAPEGLCPRCLLEAGLAEPANGRETSELELSAGEAPGGLDMQAAAGEQQLPGRIPGYRIMRRIGVGGMGSVYEAEQDQPRRTVALKVLNPHLATAQFLRRFAHEAEALGRLAHPGIARIYESGTAEGARGPQPFFAMELIHGPAGRKAPSVTEYADQKKLSIRQRLELAAKVADAVHYAHQKGIIHRDLKPANILVDETGQPKILDFGVARLTDRDVQATTMQTDVGQIIGTLPYMSPEQAAGDPSMLDTRSDVYALGVICYELLTGRLPYVLHRRMIHEAVRVIKEEEPTRLGSLSRTFRGDIEAIVAKALEKHRDRRYQSASDLATDVRRYLNDEPIAARPLSAWYQLGKFAKRNKAVVTGMAGVFAALVLGVIGTSLGLLKARKAQRQAEVNLRQAEVNLAAGRVSQADALLSAGRTAEAKQIYARAWADCERLGLATLPCELGMWDAQRSQPPSCCTLVGHRGSVNSVVFCPDGRSALSGSHDRTLKLWDLVRGKEIRTFTGHQGAVLCVALSPDGRLALSGAWDPLGSRTDNLALWDVTSGARIRTHGEQRLGIRDVAFSPDGRTALSCEDHAVAVWDVAGWRILRVLRTDPGLFSTDTQPPYQAASVAFSPDGRSALTGGERGRLGLWNVAAAKVIRSFTHAFQVSCVAFSPDGRTCLSGSFDRTLKLWDVAAGTEIRTLHGHADVVTNAAFSPDGGTALSGGKDKTCRLWDLASGEQLRSFAEHAGAVLDVAFCRDGRLALSASEDRKLKLWPLLEGRELRHLAGHTGAVRGVAFSPDGRLALSGGGKTLKLWDVATAREIRTLAGHGKGVTSVVFSPDGRAALSGSFDGSLKLWDVGRGKELRTFTGHQGYVHDVDLSPDGRTALSASEDKTVRLWDVATGKELRRFTGHSGNVWCAAFSPDGRTALSGSYGALKLWDVARGRELRTFTGHQGYVRDVDFSPDGRTALSASTDKTVRLWDVARGTQIRALTGHLFGVNSAAFSPDGGVAVSCGTGVLRIWDVAAGKEIRAFGAGKAIVCSVAFSPDGRRVLSGGFDNTVRIWDFSRPARRRALESRVAQARRTLRESPDDPASLAILGIWWAFHGLNDWAVELLEEARKGGADVPALTLARCYWELDKLEDARREFRRALALKETPEPYLKLCLGAVGG